MEGRRAIPEREAAEARGLAARLAREFVCLRFCSGNAEGSDEAFSAGVAEVDVSRLQVIAPYRSHRKRVRYTGALYSSPESLSTLQEAEITAATVAATPRNANVVYKRTGSPKLAAKADDLIRDTMKVLGHAKEFVPPVCGLCYVDLSDPEAGGTSHTIRVCRQHGIPVAFQVSWRHWFV